MDTRTVNLRDLPEELVRKAKACAALHGMTLRDFVMRAIERATEDDLPAFQAMLPMTATAISVEKKPRNKRQKSDKR